MGGLVCYKEEAEEILFDGFAAYYEKYKQFADADPEWAKDNPVSVSVEKKQDNIISITFLPVME